MSAPQHTPGPWRWEINRRSKQVELCGGPPKSGFGRYDLTVLDFRRWGMNSAAPVFWHWDKQGGWLGKPQRADELAVPASGREHHADWFADIAHPDARLIAAAPELLEALKGLSETLLTDTDIGPCIGSMAPAEHFLGLAVAAISKATATSNTTTGD